MVEIRNTIFLVEAGHPPELETVRSARARVESTQSGGVSLCYRTHQRVAVGALLFPILLAVRYTNDDTSVCATECRLEEWRFIDDRRRTTEHSVHQTHFHCTIIPISIASAVLLQRAGILP